MQHDATAMLQPRCPGWQASILQQYGANCHAWGKRGALRLVKDANKQVQVTCKKPVKSKQTLQIRPAAQSSSYGRSSAACAGCFNKF